MADARETWGRYAPSFAAEGTGAEERESIRRLVELCALPPGSLVLDVATGAGYTAFVFARTGCRVIALDPTHEMLLATREGWRERLLPGAAALVEAWAESLPFRDQSFDAIVSHRAPHQFADVAAFVDEARRVLRIGGVLGVSDQSPPDGWEDWHNEIERLRDPTHERALSRREWHSLIDGALAWERDATVFQSHDVEEWLDRVSCAEDRRSLIRSELERIPDGIRDVYRPEVRDGRLLVRTPQCVFVARR